MVVFCAVFYAALLYLCCEFVAFSMIFFSVFSGDYNLGVSVSLLGL